MNKTLKKVTIKEKLDAENSVEPVIVNKDNGTQSFEDTKTEKVTAPEQVEGAASMDNVETSEQQYEDYIETPVVIREKRIIDESLNKSKLEALVEDYKTKNPKKYAAKKEELERKIKDAK